MPVVRAVALGALNCIGNFAEIMGYLRMTFQVTKRYPFLNWTEHSLGTDATC